MNIVERYFTGTGNAERCLSVIAEKLRADGHIVDMKEFLFSAGEEFSGESPDFAIFAFSTLAFSAPAAFRRWIRHLPRVGGIPAVVIAVCGSSMDNGSFVDGYGADAAGSVARILKRRGFSIAGVYEISYPVNWAQAMNPPNGDEARALLELGDAKAAIVARDIVGERCTKLRRPAGVALSLTVSVLFRLVGRRFLGLTYVADDACTGCGLCSATCPSSVIAMRGKREKGASNAHPRWNAGCQACNRCINCCPERAIQVSPARLALLLAVSVGVLVVALSFAGIPSALLGLSGWLAGLVSVSSGIALFAVLTALQFFPGRILLDLIGRSRPGRRFFLLGSWTKGFRRYMAPGFKPRACSKGEGR